MPVRGLKGFVPATALTRRHAATSYLGHEVRRALRHVALQGRSIQTVVKWFPALGFPSLAGIWAGEVVAKGAGHQGQPDAVDPGDDPGNRNLGDCEA